MLIFEKIKVSLTEKLLKKSKLPYKNKYSFTEDWFTPNIPIWSYVLKKLARKKNIRALEVGTYQGRSALWLLENILTDESSTMVCIDIYPKEFAEAQQIFEENLKIGKFENRVELIVKNSLEILPQLESQRFDLIYLDGHHEGEFIFKESELCWPILKTGGVLIFDDYLWPEIHHVGQSPKDGIDRFLKLRASSIEILHQNYQVIVKKICE